MRQPLGAHLAGARLARPIISEDGQVLLPAGAVLTETYIRQLRRRGILTVVVDTDPRGTTLDVVSSALRQELTTATRELLTEIAASYRKASAGLRFPEITFEVDRVRRAVGKVVEEVLRHPKTVLTLQGIRAIDEYTMLHSIEVCILSAMAGNAMGLPRDDLKTLALAALLHDIGKTGIPLAILNKPGGLTPAEVEVMRRHAGLGWSLLRGQKDLEEEAALVALQHHERWSGEPGYPLRLSGEGIHPFARVCTVADVYDALTADRVYRKGLPPAEAIELMTGPMREMFDPRALEAFLQCVAPFPLGTVVELSDGRRGQVVAVDQRAMERPRIRLLVGADGRRIESEPEIDLQALPSVSIVRRVPPLSDELLEAVNA